MTTISDLHTVDNIIRNQLILQSNIDADFVRNAASIYGTTLDKNIDDDIFNSITINNTLILFYTYARESSNNITQTKTDDKIRIYTSFRVHVIIYGSNSQNLAHIMIGRLRTQKARNDLQNEGIYLDYVSHTVTIQEYKNNVLWPRNDFDINISCEMDIAQITDATQFAGYAKIDII